MIKCIAIDDEPLALNLLADNISKIPYLQLIAKCEDAFEAAKVMQEQQPGLIFIDIQMPGITGMQFIESLVKKPMVILITAYKNYALESYSLNVVDYLIKPVAMERFMKACNKALELFELRNNNNLQAATYMFVNVGYSLLKVIFSDIIWIEGLKDYVQIHLKSSSKPIMVRTSLKLLEEQLPANAFVRIHKSFIVSTESITATRKNSIFIDEKEFPVGDTYRNIVDNIVKGSL